MTSPTRREALLLSAAAAALPSGVQAAAPPAKPIAPYRAACVHSRVVPTFTGAGQFLPEALTANVERVTRLIARGAAEIDARLYVFSEFCLQLSQGEASVKDWLAGAITIPGPETDAIAKAAQAANAYVVINPVERIPAFPGRYFLSGVVIAPSGEIALNYRKLYDLSNKTRPTDMLKAWTDRFGAESLFPVADTPIGRIGCAVALDVNWPEMLRGLVFKGAEIIVNPTASPTNAPGYTLPTDRSPGTPDIRNMVRRVRAFENTAYMLTTNLGPVGTEEVPPLRDMVPSEIVDFTGRALNTAADSSEGFLTATIDIEALRRARTTAGPRNMLAQLQTEIHAPAYRAGHFAGLNGFAKTPIESGKEHTPRVEADIAALVRRGVLVRPAG